MKRRIISLLLVIFMVGTLSTGIGKDVKASGVQDYAVTLSMNGEWSKDCWLTEDKEADYYKIVIPADGFFSFKIMSYIGSFCYYDLFSGDLSEQYWSNKYVYRGTETSPESASYWTSLSKGTYILKISSSGTGRYKLQSTYKNHYVNDINAISYDSPQDINLGSTITGALTESDREDWYCIKVSKTGYYTFFCKNYVDHNFYYSLYSSDLLSEIMRKNIYGADETEPKSQQDDVVLKAGTYYIKVTGSSNATGRYMLSWDSLNQENCDHYYKTSWIPSTYIKQGYTLHTCEKCGKTYKDNYISKKTLGSTSVYAVAMKKKVRLSWNMVKDASGYQIRYCKGKKIKKSANIISIKGNRKSKRTIKKIQSKKWYSFQIRAYHNVGNKKVYGRWSRKVKVRVK